MKLTVVTRNRPIGLRREWLGHFQKVLVLGCHIVAISMNFPVVAAAASGGNDLAVRGDRGGVF